MYFQGHERIGDAFDTKSAGQRTISAQFRTLIHYLPRQARSKRLDVHANIRRHGTTMRLSISPTFLEQQRCLSAPMLRTMATGIWHESADEVKEICEGGDITVTRVHTHIGSGSDPAVWQKVR